LVVRNDNVGDVLCSTPAIRALRHAFPQAYLAALVVGYSRDAILGNPDLDAVFIYEKAKHRPDRSRPVSLYLQLRVMRQLQKKGFDLAIGMRSVFSWSEAWLVYFTRARYRLGYPPASPKDERFAFFYNLKVPPPDPHRHEVEKVLHLVGQIGVPPQETHLLAAVPEEEKGAVDSFLQSHRIDPQRLVGFHVSSRVPANRWSPRHFAAVAERLIRQDGRFVVLTCGPGDESRVEEVRKGINGGVYFFPTPSFKSLGALQERCRVFLSSDGGPMHFATAVGTPTIGLFGKTDPGMWGPWGKGNVALQKGSNADMISPEEVYAIIKEKLQSPEKPRGSSE
jgi:heptosyltransferase III